MEKAIVKLNRSGNRALAQRDIASAERSFRKLVEKFPQASEGYIGLAKTFERSNRYEDTVALVENVVDSLGSQQLLRLLADACRVLANRNKHEYVDRAIKYYETFHAQTVNPVTLYYHGNLYYKMKKDYAKALECFKLSWDNDHRSQEAYRGVLSCLKQLGRDAEIEQAKALWEERKG